MTRHILLLAILALSTSLAQADTRPNIIYIMSDDMGFSDIGCYGSEISTPNLDALAGGGLRFTQFYNTARCCPTRACLMSGLYPHQAGIGHMTNDRGYDGYRGDLNRNCVTIAEALSTSGYRRYMSGKWHVTKELQPKTEADKHNWPLQRGFERFYGTVIGAGSFFDPYTLTRDNQYVSPWSDPEYQPEQYYYTDAISDHAARFIRDHKQQTADQPFFMYVAYTAAHWPMHALDRDIAKYEGRYDESYQAIRDARYKRMIELGLIDKDSTVDWPIPEEWKESENLAWDIRNMEVYAAMIDSMDQGIGRIVDALKETDNFDNTLICFFQDNGGCAENYGRGGVGGPRADQPELPPQADDFIQPDMTPKQSRDGFKMRTGAGSMAGPADTAIGYGKGWATVSNTPFREYKHWVHEGGISTPLIAHWPAGIKRHGELETTPTHLIDMMATAVDISGTTYPTTFHDDQEIKPMEGKSLDPLFKGKKIQRDAIFWEHEGNRAVRVGDWKLVAKGANGAWELYNIANDRSEQVDLVAAEPERAARLAATWQAWAERANVLPLNPNKNQAKKQTFNTKKKRFRLTMGDTLDLYKAPFVEARPFKVSATFTPASNSANGVIVSQGGSTHGWSVYLTDGRIYFATTHKSRKTVLDSGANAQGETQVTVNLDAQGSVTLTVNGEKTHSGKVPGPLLEQPQEGIEVGTDSRGVVGRYAAPYPFEGNVESVVVELP